MERSKHGQVTYEAEANALFPEGCTEGNNSGGECEWCQVYYYGPPEDEEPTHEQESQRDDAMYRWAKNYDDLNGAPESDYDR